MLILAQKQIKQKDMLKIIYRIETKDLIYYEAVFQWGSLFAFTISELIEQLTNNYNVSLN